MGATIASAQARAGDPFDATVADDIAFAEHQLAATADASPADAWPQVTDAAGAWVTQPASAWTSGFLPGSLWLAYQASGNPAFRARAERWQAGLARQQDNATTHDIGFMLFDSFGWGARLTGDDADRRVVLAAARSLASRYSATVGATRSWGDRSDSSDFKVIVDNMMNLELLFWAARNGGEPAWAGMAWQHALTTRAHHVARDGSTTQLVDFDPLTGAVKSTANPTGIPSGGVWARGQAWALDGFAMAYRETGDLRLLETARRVAGYFRAHLPSDGVPRWYLGAPDAEPRDSSAAAIAASGLLDLAAHEPDATRGEDDRAAARTLLAALSSPAYLARGSSAASVLRHGTYVRQNTADRGTSWGDYYFLEALLRYRAGATPGGLTFPPGTGGSGPRRSRPRSPRLALSGIRVTPGRLHLTGARRSVLRVRFRLSAPARLLVLVRRLNGSPAPRERRTTVLRVRRTAPRGLGRLRLALPLGAGRYELTVTARAGSRRAQARPVAFRLVR